MRSAPYQYEGLETHVAQLTANVHAATEEMQNAKMGGVGLFSERKLSPQRSRRVEKGQGLVGVMSRVVHDSLVGGKVLHEVNPVNEIVKKCQERNVAFRDYDFSCETDPVLTSASRGEIIQKRLTTELGHTSLFGPTGDAPNINEINWGFTELGHWLASVLAIVTQEFSAQGREAQKNPKTASDMGGVKYIITPSALTASGAYSVRLFVGAKWRYVVVDDTVPCDAMTGQPLIPTMRDLNGGIVLSLIIKAVAKLFGGYSSLTTGVLLQQKTVDEANPSLAGVVSLLSGGVVMVDALPHPRSERFDAPRGGTPAERAATLEGFCDGYWDFLNEILLEKCAEVVTVPLQSVSGLKRGAVYRVLETAAVEVPGGVLPIRLLRLHAPYIQTAWKGAWCPGAGEWVGAPRVAEVLQPRTELDGSFWMEFIDFLNHFEYITAVRMFTGWNELSLTGETQLISAHPPTYELQLTHDCDIFIATTPPTTFTLNGSQSPTPLPTSLLHPASSHHALLPLTSGTHTITVHPTPPNTPTHDEYDPIPYSLRVFAQSAFVLVEKPRHGVALPL